MVSLKSPSAARAGQHHFTKRDRLPTLQEVLSLNTRPPVDLYCYYLFLQREGSEDILDFWLDVHQHENLVRAYFKDLSKNGRSLRDEWPQYYKVARTSGSAWNGLNGVTQGAGEGEKTNDDGDQHRVVSPVNSDRHRPGTAMTASKRDTLGVEDTPHARNLQRTPSPMSNGPRPNYTASFSPTLRALYPHDRSPSPDPDHNETGRAQAHNSVGTVSVGKGRLSMATLSSLRGKTSGAVPVIPRDSALNRTDLIASAERIYIRYLVTGADKEIFLPNVLRITDFPISSAMLPHTYPEPDYDIESDTLARVPDMFHSQKEWVYRAMEQDSFPRFLRSKAFGNLTPVSAMIRLILGLVVMWVALSLSFSFIFLNTLPKTRRLWIILPFTIAFLLILSYSYDMDPLLVFVGFSETTAFRTLRIREPYVKKLLMGRSMWVTFLTILLVTCATVLFTLVPGHRL